MDDQARPPPRSTASQRPPVPNAPVLGLPERHRHLTSGRRSGAWPPRPTWRSLRSAERSERAMWAPVPGRRRPGRVVGATSAPRVRPGGRTSPKRRDHQAGRSRRPSPDRKRPSTGQVRAIASHRSQPVRSRPTPVTVGTPGPHRSAL